jgi:glycosyltransferase involved in cell wall biosynthesis
MAEAPACGTPVIAFDRGAASEVVQDGVTGFLVNSVDEMVAALGRVDEIDPRSCRRHVESHFDTPVMADAYLQVYESILEGTPQMAAAPAPGAMTRGNGQRPEAAAPAAVLA